MTDHHSFSVDLACEIGVNAAVIFQNIYYWISHNEKNRQPIHYHKGKYWTFNSVRAFSEQFPYMSERTIKNCIKTLVDEKYLIKGNFNVKTYDKTNWYALGERGVSLKSKTIGQKLPKGDESVGQKLPNGLGNNCPIDSTQIAQPIPDINYNITSDKNINNDGAGDVKKFLKNLFANDPSIKSIEEMNAEREYGSEYYNTAYSFTQKYISQKYMSPEHDVFLLEFFTNQEKARKMWTSSVDVVKHYLNASKIKFESLIKSGA